MKGTHTSEPDTTPIKHSITPAQHNHPSSPRIELHEIPMMPQSRHLIEVTLPIPLLIIPDHLTSTHLFPILLRSPEPHRLARKRLHTNQIPLLPIRQNIPRPVHSTHRHTQRAHLDLATVDRRDHARRAKERDDIRAARDASQINARRERVIYVIERARCERRAGGVDGFQRREVQTCF